MQIFDCHTHIFPPKVAARAIAFLQEKSHGIPAYSDGTAEDLERHALEAGYSGWMNCPVVTSEHQMHSVNDWVAALNRWPHLSMGGLFPNAPMPEVLAEIARIKQLGLYGIKFHPEYQQFDPLDDRLAPMWQAICENQLPVLFHAGSDIGFLDAHQHSHPADFAKLARRYPKMTIICAHLGGWRNWDLVEQELAGAPVYLDTAFAKSWMTDQTQFERIIRRHGADHVLFGTDSPWNPLPQGILEIQETGLSEAEKHLIFWENAAKLFHLPPQ
jgi:predicted TIM-barrel fold metal-dependent hydrolase